MFELKILGKFELVSRGSSIPVVKSRKTRALLAYLCISNTSHTREHLCELFFDRTDDPRAALRWSLSRLRNMFGENGITAIRADRATVEYDPSGIDLDLAFVRTISETGNPQAWDLIRASTLLTRKPLSQYMLPLSPEFNDWLEEETQKLLDLEGQIVQKILSENEVQDQFKYNLAIKWARQVPASFDANHAVYSCLMNLGRTVEAEAVKQNFMTSGSLEGQTWDHVSARAGLEASEMSQTIQYCITKEGFSIAHAKVGSGPTIVKTANWLNHLELDWDSPIWGETFQALCAENTFIRYDGRGNGMSDWDVDDISFDAFVDDLSTVVDSLNLDRFPLVAMSQGCAVAIAYACRHPERVSALVLIGGYAAGWRIGMTAEEVEQRDAVMTLTRHGWGTANPAYRRIFSQTFMPAAEEKRLDWFDEFQRKTTSPENAVRFQEAFGDIDVRHLLGEVKAPTLIVHAKDDQRIKIEHGRALAAAIPNSELLELDSPNHIILGDEPAWEPFIRHVMAFLRKHPE